MGASITSYGDGMAQRVRDLTGGPVDLVFDASPPTSGSIAELIATVDDPSRVMTISNHADARQLGARVNLDHLADRAPASTFMPENAALAADGDLRIPIAPTYPLADWREAVKLSSPDTPTARSSCFPEGHAARRVDRTPRKAACGQGRNTHGS